MIICVSDFTPSFPSLTPVFASLRARDDLFCDKDNGDKVGTCEIESTTSRSNRGINDDDCKDVNKNLRRSSATKSGCKANARAKRTDKQNRSGGNTSGNRENIDGPCMRDKNCE